MMPKQMSMLTRKYQQNIHWIKNLFLIHLTKPENARIKISGGKSGITREIPLSQGPITEKKKKKKKYIIILFNHFFFIFFYGINNKSILY